MIEMLWYAFLEAASQIDDECFECELSLNRDGSGELLVRRTGTRTAPFPNGWEEQEVQAKWDTISEGIEALNQLTQKALSPT